MLSGPENTGACSLTLTVWVLLRSTSVKLSVPLAISGVVLPVTPTDLTGLANVVATGGTRVFLSTGFGLNSLVSLLDQTGHFKVLNRPVIFTSNNKKAIIASGTEIPVPVNTLTNVVNQTTANGTAPGPRSACRPPP